VEIVRDQEVLGSIAGFPTQPMEDADVFPRAEKQGP